MRVVINRSRSALKKYHRDILCRKQRQKSSTTIPFDLADIKGAHLGPDIVLPTYFAFIDGTRELLIKRMEKPERFAHFTKGSMLDGQLNTLESPVEEEGVIVVSQYDSTKEEVGKSGQDC